MKKYKVGIVDDHLLFAEGISNIISSKPNMELSFIVSSVPEMYKFLQQEKIHLLLLDINIPPYDGIELLKQLKQNYNEIKIMILTMYQPADIKLDMANFKGDAYILKTSGKFILEAALNSMINGIQYLDPNMLVRVPIQDSFSTKLKLTKREKEIISHIADGKTSKEIASILFLSELTIKTHRKNISEKLGTSGLANLISKSLEAKKLSGND